MKKDALKRLFESFEKLEDAIREARLAIANKPSAPKALMSRLNEYDSILIKQRELATSLCEHLARQNWPEVTRHVNLINGLSAMIRDDANEVLYGRNSRVGGEDNDQKPKLRLV